MRRTAANSRTQGGLGSPVTTAAAQGGTLGDQGRFRRLRLALFVGFGAIWAADYLTSGSTWALLGAVTGLLVAIVILVNPPAQDGEEYERRRREGRLAFVAIGVIFVLLVALGASRQAFWAFAGVLMLMAVISALWR
jgi:MFS-type transporter involved in bile tolerance (Atg22 family)